LFAVFKNGKQITIDASYGSILNQMQRTAQFRFTLESRINMIKESTFRQDE